MKKLCLVFGGDSLENEISVLTALKVKAELDKYSCPCELVYLDHEGKFFAGNGLLNKDNYRYKLHFREVTFHKDAKGPYFRFRRCRVFFDAVLLLCHGANAEDGTVGGFFDTLKIPCLYPGLTASSLLQDKGLLKTVLGAMGVPQTEYRILPESEFKEKMDKSGFGEDFSYPLIVKPNRMGSSIGVRKIDAKEQLAEGLFEVYRYDDVAVIERCVGHLIEVNVAVCRRAGQLLVSELERVNDEEKVLTFMDKYDNYCFNEKHIIPADISKKLARRIAQISKDVYQKLRLRSVVRFDYLIDGKTGDLFLNEINAIPGSLSYYLFEPLDIQMFDLIDLLLEQYEADRKESVRKVRSYKEEFLSSLAEK